jgi:EAL domain-containing protein (putative c-di-GMP-specific phosphodiesterase class I)
LTSKEIVGYESLVRWKHPTLGLVSPDEFIPLAEKTGLVHRIGQWVLGQAATDWPSLRQSCNGSREHPPFIAVNLSAPELCSPAMAASIDACLARHTMPPAELHIELTETVIVNSMEKVSVTIGHLTEQNVGIALDDFGTGYAGLDYLQNLPFTCLKIDKTFVQQMHTSQRSFQIVKSAIELARSMSLTTVAEGIEDEATGQLLESMGCTYAQGYLYARPLPLAEVGQWAARFRSLPIS